jgi:hypothetical protein
VNEPLSPEFILRLQRQIGNRSVVEFLRRRGAAAGPSEVVVAPRVVPDVPASAAIVETKPDVVVTPSVVPAEVPLPLSGWRRFVKWLARVTGEAGS